MKLHNALAGQRGLPGAPLAENARTYKGTNAKLSSNSSMHSSKPDGVSQSVAVSLAAGAVDFGGRAELVAPLGPVRHAFLPINKTDANGYNLALMQATKAGDIRRVCRLLFEGAKDFGDRVAETLPAGALRDAFLPVNRVNAKGQNIALMDAVKRGDVRKILALWTDGARDYGGHARKAAAKKSKEVRAAFPKVESLLSSQGVTRGGRLPRFVASSGASTTTTTTTNTTTTTTTTGTTSTTGTTRGQGPGRPPGTSGS